MILSKICVKSRCIMQTMSRGRQANLKSLKQLLHQCACSEPTRSPVDTVDLVRVVVVMYDLWCHVLRAPCFPVPIVITRQHFFSMHLVLLEQMSKTEVAGCPTVVVHDALGIVLTP